MVQRNECNVIEWIEFVENGRVRQGGRLIVDEPAGDIVVERGWNDVEEGL